MSLRQKIAIATLVGITGALGLFSFVQPREIGEGLLSLEKRVEYAIEQTAERIDTNNRAYAATVEQTGYTTPKNSQEDYSLRNY